MKKNHHFLKLFLLSLIISSCNNEDVYKTITNSSKNNIPLNSGKADVSKYISVGASFTAGFTDGALFKVGQENSFPNIISKKFALINGGDFTQPLMDDNIGGLLLGKNIIELPRLYFNGKEPTRLNAKPTTEISSKVTAKGNFGVPGLKSFHLLATGYGNIQNITKGLANPYFARFASSPTATVIGDVITQQPTFFTLSEIGGNDVLGYALSGGTGVNQSPSESNPTGNTKPETYGYNDITNPLVF